jgi:large subunit ribosomal protein L15
VESLNGFEAGSVIDAEALMQAGVIDAVYDGVKVLGNGELTVALTVKAAVFSATAKEKIEAVGGKTEVI